MTRNTSGVTGRSCFALTDEERDTLETLLDKLSADWDQRLERRDQAEKYGEHHSHGA